MNVKLDRITFFDKERQRSITQELNDNIETDSIQEGSSLYRGGIGVYFREVEGAEEVLSRKIVIMVIHYRISGDGDLKEREFTLEKKVRIRQTIVDILAAA